MLILAALLVSCRRDPGPAPAHLPPDTVVQAPEVDEPQAAPVAEEAAPTVGGQFPACTDSRGRSPAAMLGDFAAQYADAIPVVRDSAFHALWSAWSDIAGSCQIGDSLTEEIWSEDSSRGRAATAVITKAGFDWSSSEGDVFLVPRVALALRYAGDLVSPVVRRFLELSDQQHYPDPFNDAGIVIDYRELADRVFLWADSSLHQPSCVFRDEAGRELEMYMNALLSGADNTRVFWEEPESDSLRVDEAFLVAYEYVVDTYGGHPLAQIVREYQGLITAPSFDAKRDLPPFAAKYPNYCSFGLYTR